MKLKLLRGRSGARETGMNSFFSGNLPMAILALIISYSIFTALLQNHLNLYKVITGGELYFNSRVWHLYINYVDLGFIKRGLIGTVLTVTGLNSLINNEFFLMVVLNYITALGVVILVLFYSLKRGVYKDNRRALLFLFLLSPGMLHYFYWGGNLDNFLLLLLTVIVFYISRTITLVLLVFVGMCIHEAFIFFAPFIILIKCGLDSQSLSGDRTRKGLLILASFLFSALAVSYYGQIEIDRGSYYALMSLKIPLTYSSVLATNSLDSNLWWSGYNEINYGVERYFLEEGMSWKSFVAHPLPVFLGLFPVLYISFLASKYFLGTKLQKILTFFALIFPLFMAVLANDFWRYTSFAMTISFLFLFFSQTSVFRQEVPVKFVALFSPFCFLGPYGGSNIDIPFLVFHNIWTLLSR